MAGRLAALKTAPQPDFDEDMAPEDVAASPSPVPTGNAQPKLGGIGKLRVATAASASASASADDEEPPKASADAALDAEKLNEELLAIRGTESISLADLAKFSEARSFPDPDEEKVSTNSPVDDTSLDERGALRDNAGDGYLRDPEMSSTTDPEGFAAGSDEGLDMGPPGEDGSAPTGSLEFPIESGDEDEVKLAAQFEKRKAEIEEREKELRALRGESGERAQGGGSFLGGLMALATAGGRTRRIDREVSSLVAKRERLPEEFAARMLEVRQKQLDQAFWDMRASGDHVREAIAAFDRKFLATEAGRRFKVAVEDFAAAQEITVQEALESVRNGDVTDPTLIQARDEAFADPSVIEAHANMHAAVDGFGESVERAQASMRTLATNNAKGFEAEAAQARMDEIVENMKLPPPIADAPGEAEAGRALMERMRDLTESMQQFVESLLAGMKRMVGLGR